MKILKDRIIKDGVIKNGNILTVDKFLNHQIDVELLNELGKEFKKRFSDLEITKILTIEASGIGIACIAAQYFKVPVVFAKKSKTKKISGDVYNCKVESFTDGKISDVIVAKEFISPEDKILIIDDFLSNGSSILGLISIVKSAGAELCGAGIAIEKAFQLGGEIIRSMGVRVEALAIISDITDEGEIIFE